MPAIQALVGFMCVMQAHQQYTDTTSPLIYAPCQLLICQELDGGVGDDPDTVGPVAPEHAPDALIFGHEHKPLTMQAVLLFRTN